MLLLWKLPWPSFRVHSGLRIQGHSVTIHIPLFYKYWGVSSIESYVDSFYYRYTDNENFRKLTVEAVSSLFEDIIFIENVHDAYSNMIQVWTSIRPNL